MSQPYLVQCLYWLSL